MLWDVEVVVDLEVIDSRREGRDRKDVRLRCSYLLTAGVGEDHVFGDKGVRFIERGIDISGIEVI